MSIIKSFSVDKGDTFYIKHESSNFTVIDCNLVDERKDDILQEIAEESRGKDIFRVISTHPDEDHIHGLEHLDDRFGIRNFYCVNNGATKSDESPSFKRYCELRDSSKAFHIKKGCSRCWMNDNDEEKNYGSSGINVLWPVITNGTFKKALEKAAEGESPNNISPIITYSLKNGVKAIWMGDLETSFMEEICDSVDIPSVDLLFAPHHGRASGRPPKSWMKAMSPSLVVIGEADSGDLDYYSDFTHVCQNTAGDMLFECVDGYVHLFAESPYDVVGLDDFGKADSYGLSYWGSIATKGD